MAQSQRRRLTEDDLLKGFDETGPSRGRLGGFFAIAIGGSLYAWDVAFTFGVHHALVYHRRHELFVVSLVVLLGGLIMRRRVQIRPWLLALFTPPLLLVLVQLAFPVNHSGALVRVIAHILVVTTVAVLPVVIWVVARLLAPQYFTLPDRRAKVGVIAVVAFVALLGYALGQFNDHFLTCEDFQVAGDAPPKSCAHTQHR
jgi:hypothetical protein